MTEVEVSRLQGPSPDEVALVEGGRQLGFEFVARDRTTITVRVLGDEVPIFHTLRASAYPCQPVQMTDLQRYLFKSISYQPIPRKTLRDV